MDAKAGQGRLFPKRRLKRYATKDELCARGRYASIPLAVLGRTDIPPAAKTTYGALLDHLRGAAATWVYPSIARLARMTGLARSTVLRSLSLLEEALLIERRPQPGRPTCYGFAPLDPVVVEEAASQGHPKIGREGGPRIGRGGSENRTGGGPRMVQNPSDNAALNTHSGETPLHTSELASSPSQKEIEEGLARAHRLVFDCGPSSSWAATFAREYEQGDREALVQIDARAIHGGLKLARDQGGTFGLGWIIRWLHDQGATKVAAAGRQEQHARQEQVTAARDAATDAKAREELRQQLEYFATLAPDRKAHYRDAANDRGFIKRPDLVESIAALAAWNDRAEVRGDLNDDRHRR